MKANVKKHILKMYWYIYLFFEIRNDTIDLFNDRRVNQSSCTHSILIDMRLK